MRTWITLIVTMLALLSTSPLAAADKGGKREKAKPVEIVGTLSCERDEEETVLAATLTTEDGTRYAIDMDRRGAQLAQAMEGQKVKVTGVVEQPTEEGEAVTLKVRKFEAVKEENEEGADDEEAFGEM